ncbi:hypothetical protein L210DRAFT_2335655 [Boletus edulis BED1]|uniref:Uncharacterized protein n=1 Tax=Boletus edulis BED1 TaxID=1328754 RepID=A0AAD4GCL1_BOLED|nr:hypothetical protein L210DRAFT_2335655 [Boletus edulis BED1]
MYRMPLISPLAIIPTILQNLSKSLLSHNEQLGELNDIEETISSFNSFGSLFCIPIEQFGRLSDHEKAILIYGSATDLTPDTVILKKASPSEQY